MGGPKCPYDWAKRLRTEAGIDAETHNRVLQHTRRTGATDVALAGGSAWQYLGHTQPGLDRLSYVDGIKTAKTTLPTRTRANESASDSRTSANLEDPRQALPSEPAKEREESVDADQKRGQQQRTTRDPITTIRNHE